MKRTPLQKSDIIYDAKRNTHYIIDSIIGDGSNGIVYNAHRQDSNGHNYFVRIKECYPYASAICREGSELVWKNETEKNNDITNFKSAYDKLLDKQNNPNTSNATEHVFDLVEANGTLYSIMDATVGETFDKDDSKDLNEVLKTILALTKVVGEYHKSGYLHLDIKPGNFLTIPETRDLIILFDVDTITPIDDIKAGKVELVPFSKSWAAPEQMQGATRKLCPATDIFSIGAILFEKIMGRNFENDDIGIFADWTFDGDFFCGVNPKVKYLLKEIFKKTISANINKRYKSCDELIEKLEEIIKILTAGKMFLIPTYTAPLKNFIGRKDALKEINTILNKDKHVFIHAFAGMGKTELAKKYASEYSSDFHTVVFCRYDGDLMHTLKEIKVANSSGEGELKNEDFKTEFTQICNDKKILIILDNFDVDTNEDQEMLEYFLNLNCKKIITTRTDFSGRESASICELKDLQEDECKKLFEYHSGKSELSQKEDELIKDALERIAHNTYFITILAKRVARGISIEKLCSDVRSNLLKKVGKLETYKDGKNTNDTMYEIAKALFDIEKFSEKQLRVLRNLYLLKWRTLTIEQYRQIACFDMPEDDEEQAIDFLEELKRTGWVLSSGESGEELGLHPIVEELVRNDLTPSVKTCPQIAEYYSNYLKEGVIDEKEAGVRNAKLKGIFAFYKALNNKNSFNIEYVINNLFEVLKVQCNFKTVTFAYEYLSDIDFDDILVNKVCFIILAYALVRPSGEINIHTALEIMYETFLKEPRPDNIDIFVISIELIDMKLPKILDDMVYCSLPSDCFSYEDFLDEVISYITKLQHYMNAEQKNICNKYNIKFSESLQRQRERLTSSELLGDKSPDYWLEKHKKKQEIRLANAKKDFEEAIINKRMSNSDKMAIAEAYYSTYFDINYPSTPFGAYKEEERKERLKFLKNVMKKYDDIFDNQTDAFNHFRADYAYYSLEDGDVDNFKANMDLVYEQIKKIVQTAIMSNNLIMIRKVLENFDKHCLMHLPMAYIMVNTLITDSIFPYVKALFDDCELLFKNNPERKEIEKEYYNKMSQYMNRSIKLHGFFEKKAPKNYGKDYNLLSNICQERYEKLIGIDYHIKD